MPDGVVIKNISLCRLIPIFIFLLLFANFNLGAMPVGITTTMPFDVSQRAICRDGKNYIHIVWRSDSGTIKYVNSTDNGLTFTRNDSFYGSTSTAGSTKSIPSISCDGNNITVAYVDYTAGDVIIGISNDNGATWKWSNPITSNVYYYVSVERRGQKIYVVYSAGPADEADLNFFSSADGGTTWAPVTLLWDGQNWGHHFGYSSYFHPSLAVAGTGTSSDKLYVAVQEVVYEPAWGYYISILFRNSSDAGASWGPERTVISPATEPDEASITVSGNSVFIVSSMYVSPSNRVVLNSTSNDGATWSLGQQVSVGTNSSHNPSVTLNANGLPFVVWQNYSCCPIFYNIFYRNFNGGGLG